jgi:transcriptional regulator with XRE-family HTH domain
MSLTLKTLRENLGLTQPEIAKKIPVDVNTYASWEHGHHKPYLRHRQRLAEIFDMTVAEINSLFDGDVSHSCDIIEVPENIQTYRLEHLDLRLLGIVDAGTYKNQCEQLALILEEYDAMTQPNNAVYQVTRREAVKKLATFPFFYPPLCLAKQTTTIPISQYDLFLKECGASLAACEELSRIGDAMDISIAFECVSRYLIELDAITHHSSRSRQQALELAAYCAILKTNLGWHRGGNGAAVFFAQDAVTRSDSSGIIGLRLSARSKLAWAYLYGNQREAALKTAREARYLFEAYKGSLPVGIRGGVYSTLSVMQAKNDLDPDTALKRAIELGPDSEVRYLLEFTEVEMLKEQGQTLGYAGKTGEAIKVYTQMVDPETLQPTAHFQEKITEDYRLLVIEGMARVSLEGEARNRENAIRYWKATIEGAKGLDSDSKYERALSIYDVMKVVFSGEKEILNLRDHFKQR